MNKNYCLTYKDAQKIVKKYNSTNFFEKVYDVEGYKVSTFNYFICEYNDFAYPLGKKSKVNAFEMRGITFVFNKNGSLFKRYLMLPKFFNINQNISTEYNKVKDKAIKKVTSKEDGSLVAFMKLPNGNLFAKTIGSTESDQAYRVINIINKSQNKNKKEWVETVINDGYTPLFEYVSLENRIVLKYNTNSPSLRLIGVRHNDYGWLKLAPKNTPFKTVHDFEGDTSIDNLLEKAKVDEDKEGWVIQFEDGQLLKIKTQWYVRLHSLRTENIFREDYIIHTYLNEQLDDVKGELDPVNDKDAYDFIDKVVESVKNFLKWIDDYTDKHIEIYKDDYHEDWAEYAKNNAGQPYFHLIVKKLQDTEKYNELKIEKILWDTRKLSMAREFVKNFETKNV